MVLEEYIDKAIDYNSYFAFVERQIKESNDEYTEYYALNFKRMERLNKSLTIFKEQKEKLNQLQPLTYLVLTEAWCGDCAQIIPVLAKMQEASININLKILIASQNEELLDRYLINNSRSIPVVIGTNKETFKEKFRWGARPSFGNELLKKYKSDENYTKEIFQKDLQMAYNKDKGITVINELIKLHNEIK